MEFEVVPADSAQLGAIFDVWLANEPDYHRPADISAFPLHAHELRTGALLVAVARTEIIGFGATLTRSGVTYLADLFVHPRAHGQGVGRALTQHLFAEASVGRFTFSSSHPAARRLYTSYGMQPTWDLAYVEIDDLDTTIAALGGALRAVPITLDRVTDLDRAITGRDRRVDIEHDIIENGATVLGLANPGNEFVGYASIVTRRPWDPHTTRARVAPVVVTDPSLATAAFAGALCAARELGARAAMTFVPVVHPQYDSLLAAGFTEVDSDLLMASDPGLLDPLRYFPSVGTA